MYWLIQAQVENAVEGEAALLFSGIHYNLFFY
jgi:hypothetical protein